MTFAPLSPEAHAAATAPLQLPREIHTARLRLCPWRLDHFGRLNEIYGDPDTMKFIGGALDEETCWRGMAAMAGQWVLRGYGIYAIEDDSGLLVGRTGVYHPLDWPERELGYALHTDQRGRGYATEAVGAVRDAVAAAGITRLVSLISPLNHPSQRVAAKLGAVPADSGEVRESFVVRYLHDLSVESASLQPTSVNAL